MGQDTVAIVIPTFGDRGYWEPLGQRALQSAYTQSHPADEVIRYHGEDLQEARNTAIGKSRSKWIVCLDADDLLDFYYVDSMLIAQGELRYPRVKYVENDTSRLVTYTKGDIRQGNFCVIGSMFLREQFMEVGGFAGLELYEDWDLWIRLHRLGARIEPSLAIYIAHQRPDSRNKQHDISQQWADLISRQYNLS